MYKTVVLCVAVLFSSVRLFAETFYAAPNGSGGVCSQEAPCSLEGVIAKVRSAAPGMTEDITVNLMSGWHMVSKTITVGPEYSGANGHKVVFQAAPGAYPVISGGRRITGWTRHDAGKNIWKASAPGLETRQLYINCVRAVRAHSGGKLPGAVKTQKGYTTTDMTMQNWGNKSDIEFLFNAEQGGTTGARWTERRIGVASISGNSIELDQPIWDFILSPVTNPNVRYNGPNVPTDVENAYELLDEPGEWYLDRSADVVYYIPRPGEDLAGARVMAGALDGSLLHLKGTLESPVRNMLFRGITFAHATWLRPNTSMSFPEQQANICYNNPGFPPGGVHVETGRNIRFERCVFKHLGAAGLQMNGGTQDCSVEGCRFTDISSNCVVIGKGNDPLRPDTRARDTRLRIANNYIHDSPSEYRGSCGIIAQFASELKITRNELMRLPYIGISVGWQWDDRPTYTQDNEYSYNLIRDVAQSLGDHGHIYTLGPQPGTVWRHNWFDGSLYRSNGGAIFPDMYSSHMEIHDNVSSRIGNWWVHIWTRNTHEIVLRNNWSDTDKWRQNGTNMTVENNVIVKDGNWPPAARAIMEGAGIEPAWAGVRELPCACSIIREGCIDSNYVEYDPKANAAKPGACITRMGCMDSNFAEYNPEADVSKPGVCVTRMGCMDSNFAEYDSAATAAREGACKTVGIVTPTGALRLQVRLGAGGSEIYFSGVKIDANLLRLSDVRGEALELKKTGPGRYSAGRKLASGVYWVSLPAGPMKIVIPGQ